MSSRANTASAGKRLAALAEVTTVFALTHVAYRSFKHFTQLGRAESAAGLNFSTGAVMIAVTLALTLVFRRGFTEYGLTLSRWPRNLVVGLLAAALIAVGALTLEITRTHGNHRLKPPDRTEAVVYGVSALLATLVILILLRRDRPVLRVSTFATVTLLCLLLATPIAIAARYHKPLQPALLTVAWNFVCAGFGEEIFFRGYIQSRVNRAFGRPYSLLGMNFGAGLIVSALFFGLIHALNTVDYFEGRYTFAIWYGLQNIGVGLYYGALRERTNSILAGGICHGLIDVLARLPAIRA